jgi:hypothetical protein
LILLGQQQQTYGGADRAEDELVGERREHVAHPLAVHLTIGDLADKTGIP